jgi:2-phosphosulfolactate phosphatase
MIIEVLPSAGSPAVPYLEDKLALVIDVLRATSTMVTAFAHGCQGIIPVLTPEEGFEKRLALPNALLGGERRALRIEGFDLGNSPTEYVPEKVADQRIIMTTTNGTRAIRAAETAPIVLMTSFLNLEQIVSTVQEQLRKKPSLNGIVVFCSGTEDRFDLPDTLCAGMFIEKFIQVGELKENVQLNDLGEAAYRLFQGAKENLTEVIKASDHGKRLLSLGLERDIDYCATPNLLRIVPMLQEGEIVVLR